MANHLRGQTELRVDGEKTFTLSLGMNELLEIQDAMEASDAEFLARLEAFISTPRGLRRVVAIGLRREHPDATELIAGDVITTVGITETAAAVNRALAWAFPTPDPNAKAAETKAVDGTLKSSSSRPRRRA